MDCRIPTATGFAVMHERILLVATNQGKVYSDHRSRTSCFSMDDTRSTENIYKNFPQAGLVFQFGGLHVGLEFYSPY